MRNLSFFLSLSIIPIATFAGYPAQPNPQDSQTQSDPVPNYPKQPSTKQQAVDEQDEIVERNFNEYEYNLYDRQLNQKEQQNRGQQQYYYQQSGGDDAGTQYNRTPSKPKRSQYFNPRDE